MTYFCLVAVYALSFGTIMLKTDAHNDHVQDKMTEKQFIENIHYTSGGESIPTSFLIELYHRIVTSEIKFLREEMLLPDAIKMGHCFLHSKGNKWHSRWLVLSNNHLLLYKKPYVSIRIAERLVVNVHRNVWLCLAFP